MAGESVREDRGRDEVKREAMSKPADSMNAKEQFFNLWATKSPGVCKKRMKTTRPAL